MSGKNSGRHFLLAKNRLRHYAIYVPGLGDGADNGRSLALWFWRLQGVTTEFVPMRWYEGGTYEERLERVLHAIDSAQEKGYKVSLIGESAGGSMAINAAASRPSIHRLITVAGANDPDAEVSPVTLKRSPSFDKSLQTVRQSLGVFPLERTHTVHGLVDHVVRTQHTLIKGTHSHTVPTFGHMATIILCLSVLSLLITRLVKKN